MSTALILTRRHHPDFARTDELTLSLTADERTRSRHYFSADAGIDLYLRLPRGTVLQHGDLLSPDGDRPLVRVVAKPEPVFTVTAHTPLDLLKAAYHLGNRHVPLEVASSYLRLSPDPVLKQMLHQMGLHVTEEVVPFCPEAGAYGHSYADPAHPHAAEPFHEH